MIQFTSLPPLSLYIHFPWCVKKCPYCDFNSHQQNSDFDEKKYIAALKCDAEYSLPQIWGRQIHSIFMGGGTPSLFSPDSMDDLLAHFRSIFSIRPEVEITMEANPGSFEQGKFSEFRQLGINRLSIGIQSFSDSQLQALGRIHNSREAITAVETAHKVGFENINIDIMYALPQQTLKQAVEDINQAIALQTNHISHYQLTIEPNTLFHKAPPKLPNDDLSWEMQIACQAQLANNSYPQYEISAYANKHNQCRHNINYWQFGDYLGIGAGAHGKISNAQFQYVEREWKIKHPRDYMNKVARQQHIGGVQKLSRKDIALEFMMNTLRLNAGFAIDLFPRHCGLQLDLVDTALREAEQKGWIERDLKNIRATNKGRQYLNDLTALFMD